MVRGRAGCVPYQGMTVYDGDCEVWDGVWLYTVRDEPW